MIFPEDPIWYSPLNFIHHANQLNSRLTSKEKNTKEFRKVVEACAVAQMLVGIIAIEKREYWMQLVEDKYGTPDVRTIRYADKHSEKFDNLEQVDVEVVEYEAHSTIPIPEFIAKTKFSNKKSYDDNTVILCHIGGGVSSILPGREEIETQMKDIDSPCSVLLLVATNQKASRFQIIELRPRIGVLIEFDLEEKLHERKYTGVLNLIRGIRRPLEERPNEKHYPFEKLGYTPNKYGSY